LFLCSGYVISSKERLSSPIGACQDKHVVHNFQAVLKVYREKTMKKIGAHFDKEYNTR